MKGRSGLLSSLLFMTEHLWYFPFPLMKWSALHCHLQTLRGIGSRLPSVILLIT